MGEVIKRRKSARQHVGMLVGDGASHAEAEVLRDIGHRRYDEQRIVHGHRHSLRDRRVRPPAIDVMDAEDVGQKQRVEFAALEDLRELDPVFERVIAVGAIARLGPQAGRLMPDTVHVKRIEADLLWHRICCGSAVP